MSASFIRWADHEYLTVVRAGLHLKSRGPLAVLKAGQAALPKAQRMDVDSLERRVKSKPTSWWEAIYARAAEVPEVAAQPVKEGPPPGVNDSGRKTQTYWTKLEWARAARLVEELRKGDPEAKLYKLYERAQLVVIDTDRQKTAGAFYQAHYAKKLAEYHKQGLSDVWLLKDEDKAAKLAAAQELKAQTTEANNAAQAERLAQAVSEPTSSSAGTHAPPPTIAAPGAAAVGLPATLAALTIETPGIEAALATFGQTLASAVGLLIQASQRETRSMIDSKLAAASSRIGEQVASMVRATVGSVISEVLIEALNAPAPVPSPAPAAPTPAPAAAPAAAPAVASAPAPVVPAASDPEPTTDDPAEQKKLKVDVLGLDTLEQTIKVANAVRDYCEVKFFAVQDRNVDYSPHRGRTVLLAQGTRLQRKLQDKFTSSKVKAQVVNKTPFHMIHAIEELARSKGISV